MHRFSATRDRRADGGAAEAAPGPAVPIHRRCGCGRRCASVSFGPPDADPIGAEVAQSVEHRPEEAGVVSSILTLGTSNAVSSMNKRAEVAQLVEHHLAKVRVAGSSPVFRSIFMSGWCGSRLTC